MEPGDLIEIPFNQIVLRANQLRWDSVRVEYGFYLLCIEKMELTTDWTHFLRKGYPHVDVHLAVANACVRINPQFRYTAEKEFRETGKVKGHKFLCPNGQDYAWLSHYDARFSIKKNRS